MMTIGEVAEWILRNRRGKAFEGYSLSSIIRQLSYCADNNTMLCVTEGNQIVGVVCCEKHVDKKIMFIQDILTTKSGIVKRMAEFFRDNYPQYEFTGINRHGRKRKFTSINKVVERL